MPPRSPRDTPRQRRAKTPREVSLGGSLYQAFSQTALPAQPDFDPSHPAIIALVIVSQEMEEPVQRQNLELGQLGMSGVARLPLRHAARDDDISEKAIRDEGLGIRGKRKHIRCGVLSPVLTV